MSLTKYRPLFQDSDLWGFPNRALGMSPFFNDGDLPRVNIRDTGKNYEVELALPGYKKEDLKIDVDQGLLTVSCEKEENSSSEQDGYSRREFRSSSFTRSFSLPDAADDENVSARFDQGVLKLAIAKRKGAEVKPRKEVKIT